MVWTKTLPDHTPAVADTDLSAHLNFDNPADFENVVLDDMAFALNIKGAGTIKFKVTDALTGQQLTDFRQALAALRDYGLGQAGYIDV